MQIDQTGLLRGSFIAALLFVFVCGCSTPMVPPDVKAQVTPGTAFKEVTNDPNSHRGQTVLWGGHILKSGFTNQQGTVEILDEPLGAGDQPKGTDQSDGRFILVLNEDGDPVDYALGRQITIVGDITGAKSLPATEGQPGTRCPVVAARHVYLWPKPELPHPPGWYDKPTRGPPWDTVHGFDTFPQTGGYQSPVTPGMH